MEQEFPLNQMNRSKAGLSAAGEWHRLKPLFTVLDKKSVLDLGRGYGWHCKFSREQGAARVLGIDLSEKMIGKAWRSTIRRTWIGCLGGVSGR